MDLRVDYYALGAGGMDGLSAIGDYIDEESSLAPELVELVKLRASQINGCAHCALLHAERLDDLGEEASRLHTLATWEEASGFTRRERAALTWTEAVTRVSEGLPDGVRQAVREHFTDEELVELTFVIGAINVYNRLAVSFREPTVEP